eukprot:1978630-Rhodomonas_salina.2
MQPIVRPQLVHVGGADLPQVVNAVCSVMPLDFFIEDPALHMAPQAGVSMPPLGTAVIAGIMLCICDDIDGTDSGYAGQMPRLLSASTVLTLERRPYGNVILTKGVVGPDGKDLKP